MKKNNTPVSYEKGAKKPKKKSGCLIAIILFIVLGFLGNKGESETTNTEDTTVAETIVETSTPETTVAELSNQEIFVQALTANPDVTEDAAKSTFDIITNSLGFSEISNIDNPSGTLFEVNADGYHLKITVSDKLYKVICGNYNLYNDNTVQYTKQDLEDRSLKGNESSYYVIAQEIVSNNLKNPSSAKFSSLSECKMARNKEYVAVQGYVDATNSFGAQIRSPFTVEFRVIDLTTFNYELVYINIDGDTAGEFIELN